MSSSTSVKLVPGSVLDTPLPSSLSFGPYLPITVATDPTDLQFLESLLTHMHGLSQHDVINQLVHSESTRVRQSEELNAKVQLLTIELESLKAKEVEEPVGVSDTVDPHFVDIDSELYKRALLTEVQRCANMSTARLLERLLACQKTKLTAEVRSADSFKTLQLECVREYILVNYIKGQQTMQKVKKDRKHAIQDNDLLDMAALSMSKARRALISNSVIENSFVSSSTSRLALMPGAAAAVSSSSYKMLMPTAESSAELIEEHKESNKRAKKAKVEEMD